MTTPNIAKAGLSAVPTIIVSTQEATTGDQTLYTVPTSTAVKLTAGSICNVTASAVTVSLSLVPSGGTVGDGTHRVLYQYSLAAGDTLSLRDYLAGHVMGDGDKIVINCGTGAAVDIVISAVVMS